MKAIRPEHLSEDSELKNNFRNPPRHYRDMPFWAWNGKLETARLKQQIGDFAKMGMGGFFMHSRAGLETRYLSGEFLNCVDESIQTAAQNGLTASLYDEDRWPSGSAGGMVTCNRRYWWRGIRFAFTPPPPEKPDFDRSNRLLAVYDIRLDEYGDLLEYHQVAKDAPPVAGFRRVYAFMRLVIPFNRYNGNSYADLLNPAAGRRFLDLTHERYAERFGSEFGKQIPYIFTDEPQFFTVEDKVCALDDGEAAMPWTDDLPESYFKTYHEDIFEHLPEVVWNLADQKFSQARYRFHEHVAERFASGFADQIGAWCQAHNLKLTGHLQGESTLRSQTVSVGEAMRSYRAFQLPGVDMLEDRMELATVKQAQSAARQYNREGVLSEVDGVTDWDFAFFHQKAHGDWQAALGVTVRVPHLSWYSIKGAAKRDYPGSYSSLAPWHEKYPVLADHFARIHTLMSRGTPEVRVAVVHPVESYWIAAGPLDRSGALREKLETDFAALFDWLSAGLPDFDLLCESLLPSQDVHVEGKVLCVGSMRYEAVVVPPVLTLRASTLQILEAFSDAGGRVIFTNQAPEYCDALPSCRALKLAQKTQTVPWERYALLTELASYQSVTFNTYSGIPAKNILWQKRVEKDGTVNFFAAHTSRAESSGKLTIAFAGLWSPEEFDTLSGETHFLPVHYTDSATLLEYEFPAGGHLLLRLHPGASADRIAPRSQNVPDFLMYLESGEMKVSLSEPNVLVLDTPAWRYNGGVWQPPEEMLRLDGKLCAMHSLPPHDGDMIQPWACTPDTRKFGRLELKFRLDCKTAVAPSRLALEDAAGVEIALDGKQIELCPAGFWADAALECFAIPALPAGQHELIVKRTYTARTMLENMFLLGDFGVEVRGTQCRLTQPVRSLVWGDITRQGLPFYSGNLTYEVPFYLANAQARLFLKLPDRGSTMDESLNTVQALREVDFAGFRGMLLEVALDGKKQGEIAFAPYTLTLPEVAAGTHTLAITLYNSRINSFGALHLAWRKAKMGPAVYHARGEEFSYAYRLTPVGILRAPLLLS